jgi:hypothetical protein
MIAFRLYPSPWGARLLVNCGIGFADVSLEKPNCKQGPISRGSPVAEKHKESDEDNVVAADAVVGIRKVDARNRVVVACSKEARLTKE